MTTQHEHRERADDRDLRAWAGGRAMAPGVVPRGLPVHAAIDTFLFRGGRIGRRGFSTPPLGLVLNVLLTAGEESR
jgi:hypothetical protein